MFSGLPCKTHIAHIAHIARTRGRVEVQRVGVHIAHMAHIAWSWGRPLSLEGVSQMAYIVPERLTALVRPAFDLVLRRIRSLKRCVEA